MLKSKSKARREQAVAVRSQLWKAAQNRYQGATKNSDIDGLPGILHKLAGPEALVQDLHWVAVGQWQRYGIAAASGEAADVQCGTGQLGSALCASCFGSGVQFAAAQFLGAPADAQQAENMSKIAKDESTADELLASHPQPQRAKASTCFGSPWQFLLPEE